MLVKYWMRKAVITVNVGDSMQEAINRMKEYFLQLLPVLKDGKLVGVITDRDLKRASASDATSLDMHELAYLIAKIKCEEIMTKNPITVPPDFTLEETAALLLHHKISGAPVMDKGGRLAGVIGQRDIYRALLSLTGFEKRGLQLAFSIVDGPGSIKQLTDVIRNYGGRLVSVLSSYERAAPGHRLVYIRAYNLDRGQAPKMIEELKTKGTLLYLVDHREGAREEFAESERVE
ncbi:MAG: CBS domain-containing protein [Deltaproteobacteria bacterium]|nr:CBS domain-containing protein [Deltaproteobacteria bacterium]